jgi:hypothetical protein
MKQSEVKKLKKGDLLIHVGCSLQGRIFSVHNLSKSDGVTYINGKFVDVESTNIRGHGDGTCVMRLKDFIK